MSFNEDISFLMIQTARSPSFLVKGSLDLTQEKLKEFYLFKLKDEKDLKNIKEIKGWLAKNKAKILAVNKGPGSYSGIRQGISFTLGIFHAKKFLNEEEIQILTFTSFDFIFYQKLFTSPKEGEELYFIYAWPRKIQREKENKINVEIQNIKGFTYDLRGYSFMNLGRACEKYKKIYFYLPEKKLKEAIFRECKDKRTNILLEDEISASHIKKFTLKLLLDNLPRLKDKTSSSQSITPLYINPVSITKPKDR